MGQDFLQKLQADFLRLLETAGHDVEEVIDHLHARVLAVCVCVAREYARECDQVGHVCICQCRPGTYDMISKKVS
jgi:hypothetical protein